MRLDRARAGDRRARDLDRRAETDNRGHPVGRPPVAREGRRTEKLDAREEIERAHRVAHVREGARDATVLDEERTVPRGAGHRRALRVRGVRVVEARDEYPAPYRPDELLARLVAAGHREIAGVPADRVPPRIRRVSRRPRVEPPRRLAVVHDALRDAGLHERDPLLWRAFDIERD